MKERNEESTYEEDLYPVNNDYTGSDEWADDMLDLLQQDRVDLYGDAVSDLVLDLYNK